MTDVGLLMVYGASGSGPPTLGAGAHFKEFPVQVQNAAGGYVIANGVDRKTADELRKRNDGVVVSKNANGTYRVTKAR